MSTHAGYAEACNQQEDVQAAGAWASMLAYFLREIAGSPVRSMRVFRRILATGPSLLRAFQLLQIRPLSRFVCANPKFLFKHLPPKYLLRNMPAQTRTACFVHHYRRLHSALPDWLFAQLLEEDASLFRLDCGEHRFTISLGRARAVKGTRQVDHEGELNLRLLVDDAQVFVLSFTIVPGSVAASQAEEVLLITRVQGSLNVHAQVSLASKAMHGIPPEMLLIAALQGVSEAIGIPLMAGVSAERHLCYEPDDDALFRRAYDDLFASIGAEKNASGFYMASFPLAEKAPAQAKRGKSRSRARRAFKREVAASAVVCLCGRSATAAACQAGEADLSAATLQAPAS